MTMDGCQPGARDSVIKALGLIEAIAAENEMGPEMAPMSKIMLLNGLEMGLKIARFNDVSAFQDIEIMRLSAFAELASVST